MHICMPFRPFDTKAQVTPLATAEVRRQHVKTENIMTTMRDMYWNLTANSRLQRRLQESIRLTLSCTSQGSKACTMLGEMKVISEDVRSTAFAPTVHSVST